MISAASGPQTPSSSPSPPAASGDQRRERRLSLFAQAETLEVYDAETGWQPLAGRVVDVSGGGAGLLVGRELAPQTRVRVSFPIPPHFSFALGGGWEHAGGMLRERGRVVFCAPEPAAGGVIGGPGDGNVPAAPLWRIGLALPPSPPSDWDHISVRVLCLLVLLLLYTATAVIRGGEGGVEGLFLFGGLIVAILASSEVHYFLERRSYRDTTDRWVAAMGEAPDELPLRRRRLVRK